MNIILDAALDYHSKGLSFIPCNMPTYEEVEEVRHHEGEEGAAKFIRDKAKTPRVVWRKYQTQRATVAEARSWFTNCDPQRTAIALLTGGVSGLAVVDQDRKEAVDFAHLHRFPPAPSVKTGKPDGYHLYYRHTPGLRNFQARANLPGLDFRGEGGYVIAPPSPHYLGGSYQWLDGKSLDDLPLIDGPWDLLFPSSRPGDEYTQRPLKELYKGVSDGSRNTSLARLAGSWVNDGLDFNECLVSAEIWNTFNNPPMEQDEIIRTINSIIATHERGGGSRSSYNSLSSHSEKSTPIPWPSLSRDALPGIVGEFVDAACAHSEADPVAVLATFLSRFGIQCGTLPHFLVGDSRHHARVNVVIIGDSSKARKGTSAGPVEAVFMGTTNPCHTTPGPLSSGEGIINAVRDEQQAWVIDKKTKVGSMQTTDPGIEDKRLFVLDEEFAAALQCTKREGNTLSSVIRTLFDKGNAEPLTKANKIKTTGAHVGIVTHITIGELKKLLTETEQINGFGNRFLWVLSKRQRPVPFPQPLDATIKARITQYLDDAVKRSILVDRLSFSTEAKELWASEYHDLSEAVDGRVGSMVSRGEVMVIRLSMIYALLAKHKSIEVVDLKAALALWDYCLESALYLFADHAPVMKRHKRTLDLISEEGITRSDLLHGLGGHVKAEELDELLAILEQEGTITVEKVQLDGSKKPSTIIKRSANLTNFTNFIDQTEIGSATIENSIPNSQFFDWDEWFGVAS